MSGLLADDIPMDEGTSAAATPPVPVDTDMAGEAADETPAANESLAPETPDPVNLQEESLRLEEQARQYLAKQLRPVIIPLYAAWFLMELVHEIEQRLLPEFFQPEELRNKTPEVYTEYRDFMVNAYRLNPTEYLTVTSCRRNLAGDVALVIRVHAFLEQWGLINYQVDPKMRPSLVGPQYTGHFQITLDTPDGLVPFVPEDAEVVAPEDGVRAVANGHVKEEALPAPAAPDTNPIDLPLNITLRRNVYDTTADALALREDDRQRLQQVAPTKTYVCYVCGNDATEVRYHNLRSKQSLCLRCFEEGQFPGNFAAADFVRLKRAQQLGPAAPWTEPETLLLLEGVEMFDNDWNRIATHVGLRDREQCVLKFVQLPIEDRYLSRYLSRKQLSAASQACPRGVEDPVVRTIAFLAQTVDKEAAARAVEAALEELQGDGEGDGNTKAHTNGHGAGSASGAIEHAAAIALGKMSGEAVNKLLDETRIQEHLVQRLVELQAQKLELKFLQLTVLEDQLRQQQLQLEDERKAVLVERLVFRQQVMAAKTQLAAAADALKAQDPEWELQVQAAVEEIGKPVRPVQVQTQGTTAAAEVALDTVVLKPDLEPLLVEEPALYLFWSG